MTQATIPLISTPSQVLNIPLGGQPTEVRIYQKAFGVFVDISVNDAPIIAGVQARNLVPIVGAKYRGFRGDVFFFDEAGVDDPQWPGLGGRFVLVYDNGI